MGTEDKLVRRIEGTLASPAGVQNKQHKFDVGSDTGRDRTRHIYKDSSTKEHIFITLEEVEDIVSEQISVLPSNVFVLVETPEQMFNAMNSSIEMNIWCVCGFITNNQYTVWNVTARKFIYTRNSNDFQIAGTATDITLGANVYFMGPINTLINITISNGSDDIYFKYIECPTSLSIIRTAGTSKVYIEGADESFYNFSAFVEYRNWSKESPVMQIKEGDSLIRSAIVRQTRNDMEEPTIANGITKLSVITNATTGGEITSYDGIYRDTVLADGVTPQTPTALFESQTLDTAGGSSAWTGNAFFKELINSNLARQIDKYGHTGFQASPEPWSSAIQAVDIGPLVSLFTDFFEGGTATNAYKDQAGVWRRRQNLYARKCQHNYFTGLYEEFASDVNDSPNSADSEITWVKVFERDKYGNTAQGGATLSGKTLDSTDWTYHFDGNTVKLIGKTGSNKDDIFFGHNTYFSGTSWLSITASGDNCSYYALQSSVFPIRRSTAVASSVHQIMDMSVTITPS